MMTLFIAKLSMYLSQHTNNMRQVKIGFHDDYYDKTFYLTASNEVGKEGTITATEVNLCPYYCVQAIDHKSTMYMYSIKTKPLFKQLQIRQSSCGMLI